jgi:hypothetical protein
MSAFKNGQRVESQDGRFRGKAVGVNPVYPLYTVIRSETAGETFVSVHTEKLQPILSDGEIFVEEYVRRYGAFPGQTQEEVFYAALSRVLIREGK